METYKLPAGEWRKQLRRLMSYVSESGGRSIWRITSYQPGNRGRCIRILTSYQLEIGGRRIRRLTYFFLCVSLVWQGSEKSISSCVCWLLFQREIGYMYVCTYINRNNDIGITNAKLGRLVSIYRIFHKKRLVCFIFRQSNCLVWIYPSSVAKWAFLISLWRINALIEKRLNHFVVYSNISVLIHNFKTIIKVGW